MVRSRHTEEFLPRAQSWSMCTRGWAVHDGSVCYDVMRCMCHAAVADAVHVLRIAAKWTFLTQVHTR
ncbi:MAG: hypothetical protein KatS3mg113_1099 [Planctomycetaceae bacterium]|nr:MAG: hypothetical protein KatS3mg113_1099 [Planctomycetaceae bacterium]